MTKKTGGMIAAGHAKTAEAGREILNLGGNAFDAALASILASFVVEPTLTSAAGGGFFLAHTRDDRNLLFDFFTQTPQAKRPGSDLDFYPININFGDAVQMFHVGLGSIAVPGNLAGIFAVHERLGTLPLSVIAEPAIAYADQGVEVSPFQSFCINKILAPILLASPYSRQIFAPEGELLKTGEVLYMKDFAETLKVLMQQGSREFYEGDMARQLVKDCQEKGGYLTLEDLRSYQVIVRQPLQVTYHDRQLLTNPPPSSGGALIGFALKLLEAIEDDSSPLPKPKSSQVLLRNTRQRLQILAQVMALTNEARKDGYDDHLDQENVAQQFLAQSHLQKYQQSLHRIVNKWGSTTHISIMDEWGNAASVTTSNGEGSAYMIPGTGIMMNNMLGEEDLNPFGFHQWESDRRLSSMMAPTMLLQHHQPEIVLGSGGSNRIRTAILQVITNLVDRELNLAEAINAPRVHWENNIFHLEPPYDREIINQLELPPGTEIRLWQEQNMFFGGVHGVQKNPQGVMEGAGDPRRGGAVN